MQANVGDWLVIHGHKAGEPDRKAEILEVHGKDGAPLYVLRWLDGHESVFFPSPDDVVEHHPRPRAGR
ncbi:MAG: DUF1918 domain-containing protein [Actinomadura sp.]